MSDTMAQADGGSGAADAPAENDSSGGAEAATAASPMHMSSPMRISRRPLVDDDDDYDFDFGGGDDKENAGGTSPVPAPRDPGIVVDLAALRAASDIEAITAELLAETNGPHHVVSEASASRDAGDGDYHDGDSDGRDSDGNVYPDAAIHPRPTSAKRRKQPAPAKYKKPSKKEMFELKKETSRIQRERSVSVQYKKSSLSIEGFLKSRIIGGGSGGSGHGRSDAMPTVAAAADPAADAAADTAIATENDHSGAGDEIITTDINDQTGTDQPELMQTTADVHDTTADPATTATHSIDAVSAADAPAAPVSEVNDDDEDTDDDDDAGHDFSMTDGANVPPTLAEIHAKLLQNCRKPTSKRGATPDASASLATNIAERQKKAEMSIRALVAAAASSMRANASVMASVAAKSKAHIASTIKPQLTYDESNPPQTDTNGMGDGDDAGVVDSDDDDAVDLEIVAVRGPGAAVADLTITGTTGPVKVASSAAIAASRHRRNRDLLKVADRQIRERRQQAIAEQQRVVEEARQRKAALKAARAAARRKQGIVDDASDDDNAVAAAIGGDGDDESKDAAKDESKSNDNDESSRSTPVQGDSDVKHVSDKDDGLPVTHHDGPTKPSLMDRRTSNAIVRKLGLWDDDDDDDDDNNDDDDIQYDANTTVKLNDGTEARDVGRETPATTDDTSTEPGLLMLLDIIDSQESTNGDVGGDSGMSTPAQATESDAMMTPLMGPDATMMSGNGKTMVKPVAVRNAYKPPLPPNDIRSLLMRPKVARSAMPSSSSSMTASSLQMHETDTDEKNQAKSSQPSLSGISGAIEFLSGAFVDASGNPLAEADAVSREAARDTVVCETTDVDMEEPVVSVDAGDAGVVGDQDDDDLMALLSGDFKSQKSAMQSSVSINEIVAMTNAQLAKIKRGRRVVDDDDDDDDDADDEGGDDDDEDEDVGNEAGSGSDDESTAETVDNNNASASMMSRVGQVGGMVGVEPETRPVATVAPKPKSAFIEEEAEVEEDEFMHLGGADGEMDAALDHYEKDMLADNDIDANDHADEIVQLHQHDMLERDKTEFQNLLHDVTSGNLRKRSRRRFDPTGKGLDLIDSDEENEELLRRIREKFMRKKDDGKDDGKTALERLAQDPKTIAFAKCLAADADIGGFGHDGDDGGVGSGVGGGGGKMLLAGVGRLDKGLMSSDSDEGDVDVSDSARIRRVASLGHMRLKPKRQTKSSSSVSNPSQGRSQPDVVDDDEPVVVSRRGLRRRDGARIHTELNDDDDYGGSGGNAANSVLSPIAMDETPSVSAETSSVTGSLTEESVFGAPQSSGGTSFERMMARKRRQLEIVEETRRYATEAASLSMSTTTTTTTTASGVRTLSSSSVVSSASDRGSVGILPIGRHQRTQRLISKRSFSEAALEGGRHGQTSGGSTTGSIVEGLGSGGVGKRNTAFQIGVRSAPPPSSSSTSTSTTTSIITSSASKMDSVSASSSSTMVHAASTSHISSRTTSFDTGTATSSHLGNLLMTRRGASSSSSLKSIAVATTTTTVTANSTKNSKAAMLSSFKYTSFK